MNDLLCAGFVGTIDPADAERLERDVERSGMWVLKPADTTVMNNPVVYSTYLTCFAFMPL